ncbi:MAG: ABC transporter ATP-binding protein [Butyrivibrio sp.]|nr:ABC transporter ATP-binding protein [Butyrivibrio sp.]
MTIILEDITKIYEGRNVLDHFNLNIEDDRCYGIVGPEGCGKTTVLKIFMGTIKPDGGEVHLMGDYKYPTLHSGYVSQEGQLNHKKNAVWNVKKVYFRASKGRVIEELSKFIPQEKLKLPVSELTPAERRLVEIVRAFVIPADFLVMDEPFMDLDDEQRQKAIAYIKDNRGSRPLLIASRSEEYLDFTRVIHMNK